jgi:hypothetical protein
MRELPKGFVNAVMSHASQVQHGALTGHPHLPAAAAAACVLLLLLVCCCCCCLCAAAAAACVLLRVCCRQAPAGPLMVNGRAVGADEAAVCDLCDSDDEPSWQVQKKQAVDLGQEL